MAQSPVDDDERSTVRKVDAVSAVAAGELAANFVQHVLLVTDGTVTNVLEAYAGEAITVVKLRQTIEPAGRSVSDLEVHQSDSVMRREVLLRGTESGRTFVHALSQIVPERLDPAIRRGLLESSKPIGRLIEEKHLETFREILSVQREQAGARGIHFGLGHTAPVTSRTYRIIAGGRPIMLITETFPVDAFRA